MKLRNKKTGDIAEVLTDTIAVNVLIDRQDITGYYGSLAELNDEWEDYEEPKVYWYIDDAGVIQIDQVLASEINMRKSIGNYFETEEEAEQAVKKLKAWKRLKDKEFEFCRYSALGYGEIDFRLDFEDLSKEETEQLREDLNLLFGGEE